MLKGSSPYVSVRTQFNRKRVRTYGFQSYALLDNSVDSWESPKVLVQDLDASPKSTGFYGTLALSANLQTS